MSGLLWALEHRTEKSKRDIPAVAAAAAAVIDWFPTMPSAHTLLGLLAVSIFLSLTLGVPGQPKTKLQNPKGKRKGAARPKVLPSMAQGPLDLVQRVKLPGEKVFALMEEYERSIQEMVTQLRNSSEPSKGKCEVNLQLWMSNKRSLSPWAYSLNHDPARIPVDLPEARCLCLGCINPFTMQEDRTMVSVPIYSQIPVRRHLCSLFPRAGWRQQKACAPRPVMETIAVGCTCIF
ncbi:interleukin-17B [Trichosurus vulpecula]|uniref:interleukin-17B n=1 Tax=Trichosurus vulpecula TaxID=9337 RepID=UPI00186B109F|nr:interleukin-17B [Trichosurus vulpecula]